MNVEEICESLSGVIQVIGMVVLIFKIAIPILIISFGIFDFGKAVVADKQDEIKTQTKRLIYRAIAGLAIFFIPGIITGLFTMFDEYKNVNDDGFKTCINCFEHPMDCS